MAWDKSEPQDTTKIRNLGAVIRNNNAAIEDAESSFKPVAMNLNNRTPLAVSNDPTQIADSYIVYCKDDTAGNPELFGIDDAGNVSQLTTRSNTLSANGHALIAPGVMMQWGTDGATAVHNVTFPTAFSSSAWSVTAVPIAGDGKRTVGVSSISSTGFTAITGEGGVGNQAYAIYWQAIGPA